ncbi:salutaridine reductase-like [Capsicum annuum]|uniref:salutaridine reductase-like n=1 Tax=Capsicum annuum TaxID=4072 RepID=UPI001FB14A58|nr:salutaridine reductase-like [Capsicum annuum]XP_047255189.1 salutaridine reductase-like [Capsicum annuum]XP_047255190.1 salutaridine reductase-like [Capsicum annuum]
MLVGMQWLQEQTRELALRLSNSSQIQVNHAGASGVVVDEDVLRALNVDPEDWLAGKAVNVIQVAMKTTYESAKLCLDTNYYGDKNVTEALLPLLQNSTSARIVNVSSLRSELKQVPNEQRRGEKSSEILKT